MGEIISGDIVHIIYNNPNNGYTVAQIDAAQPIIAVGIMPDLFEGVHAELTGEYVDDKKFGRQFSVSSYTLSMPSDLSGIEAFLSGGFIKGVGEVLSSRIVEKFKEHTFDIIENEPERLAEVKGITLKLAKTIHETFLEYAHEKLTYTELMGLGLTARQANLAATQLGADAAAMIKTNPYDLVILVPGFTFGDADRVADKLGIEKNDPLRIQHAVLNVLYKSLNNGDMFVIKSMLIPHICEKIGVEVQLVEKAINELRFQNKIVLKRYAKGFEGVFVKAAYDAEKYIASKLFKIARTTPELGIDKLNARVKAAQKMFGLTEEQAKAVKTAAKNRICVLTGGPGTGKTTILNALLYVLGSSGISCALAAPTGRAAKRMNETTGEDAKTLHRLLEYSYDEDAYQCFFNRNSQNPLEADAVIVDEVSMVDAFLMRKLLSALKEGSRLVLVGDADQLPSVGPGEIMRDVISSEVVPVVKLTHVFRNEGAIADNAFKILKGGRPDYDESNFIKITPISEASALNILCAQYKDMYDKKEEVQVISPVKKGVLGTVNLNKMLQETVNPENKRKNELQYGERTYRVGDRVMQIKNNYSKEWNNPSEVSDGEGVFNGDMGEIVAINENVIYVEFEDGKICEYQGAEIAELDMAYAYTVHKSQGSEFDNIIIPLMSGYGNFFSRQLLYTAVTRAKKKVIIIGRDGIINFMISNETKSKRRTALSMELKILARTFNDKKELSEHIN